MYLHSNCLGLVGYSGNLCMFYGHCLARVKGLFKHLEFEYADALYLSQTAASQLETVVIIPGKT